MTTAILSAIARAINLPRIATAATIAPFPLKGFPTSERLRSVCEGIRESMGRRAYIAACFDRDYRCDEELDELRAEFNRHVDKLLILRRHELESYLWSEPLLQRVIDRLAARRATRRTAIPGAREVLSQATGKLNPRLSPVAERSAIGIYDRPVSAW